MKACKTCKGPFSSGVELSVVIRTFAIFDIVRLFICVGPMLTVFFACTNLNPMQPKSLNNRERSIDGPYILYAGRRQYLSSVEEHILSNVEHECGKEYKYYLPSIWKSAVPTLYKSLYLMGGAIVLPVVTSVLYFVFQKKERIAFYIGLLHLCFVLTAIVISVYGLWYIADRRLCLLDAFSDHFSIPVCFAVGVLTYAIITKVVICWIIYRFVRNHFKLPREQYRQPTPAEELLAYIKELKALGAKPHVKFSFPEDPKDMQWDAMEQLIQKILVGIRIQVAEMHRDDPLINDLLESGKLRGTRAPKKTSSAVSVDHTAPNILKIAKAMASESSEYKLLKQHHHSHHYHKGIVEEESHDDVEIILPEPDLRSDADDL